MLVGVPGCGKSYFVDKNGSEIFGYSYELVNLDSYGLDLLKDVDTNDLDYNFQRWRGENNEKVKEIAVCRIKNALLNRKTVVLDNMNLNGNRRASDIKQMRDFASKFKIDLFVAGIYFEKVDTLDRIKEREPWAVNKVNLAVLQRCIDGLQEIDVEAEDRVNP